MNRVGYLDQAKAWGMFLVYYGHFLEVLLRADVSAAFSQWKMIYSFHMPFFFFVTILATPISPPDDRVAAPRSRAI